MPYASLPCLSSSSPETVPSVAFLHFFLPVRGAAVPSVRSLRSFPSEDWPSLPSLCLSYPVDPRPSTAFRPIFPSFIRGPATETPSHADSGISRGNGGKNRKTEKRKKGKKKKKKEKKRKKKRGRETILSETLFNLF